MRKAHLGAFLLFGILAQIWFTPELLACSCRSPSVADAYRHSEVIFMGTVTQVEIPSRPFARVKARFQVEMSWRGVFDPQFDVWTTGDSCEYTFNVGETYLVYAYREPSNGLATTAVCTRTHAVRCQYDDVVHITSMSLSPMGRGARVYGFASKRRGSEDETPLAGLPVIAESSGNAPHTITTDSQGKYDLVDLPPGHYRISVKAQKDFTCKEFSVNLEDAHQYARHDFRATAPRYPLP